MSSSTQPREFSKSSTLSLLFSRPGEPIFMPKRGEGMRAMFEVPDDFLDAKYKVIKEELDKKWKTNDTVVIPVQNVSIPDISKVLTLERDRAFSLFLEPHQEIADELINIFMNQKTTDDLISVAVYCHDRVNQYMFNYALSVAILHREDTKDVLIPNFLQTFPSKFVDSTEILRAKEEVKVVPREARRPIVIPLNFTANEREPEQKVAYFREDIGMNLHHWHWHLVYPGGAITNPNIVRKDRRGELFYYMHQQVMARYNIERFCNDLPRVLSLENFRDIVPEAYFPKLVQGNVNRTYPPRFANIPLTDVNRPGEYIQNIARMELWETNLKEAISKRMAIDRAGRDVSLAGDDGIEILANMLESSSVLSINRRIYGNYHNAGHMIIAYVHDPEGKWLEDTAVMGDPATSFRDPIFFRWHGKLNDMFVSLKDQLPPYTKSALTFNDVIIKSFDVTSERKPVNEFHTYWQQSSVDTSRGLDFTPLSPITVTFTHLQHKAFTYTIKVKNTSNKEMVGYARIFLAPKCKEGGQTMDFNEQRKFMIELDKFRVNLKVGNNIITRKSIESTVTISFEKTFRDLDLNRPNTDDESPEMQAYNFCRCGWPQHLLIPKGTEAGAEYEMFVMVSDYETDKIDQDIAGLCNDAESFCGIQDRKYPDKKPMGYPFDRPGEANIKTLADFLTPNMKVQKVVIKFKNRVKPRAEPRANVSVVRAPAASWN